MVFQSWNLNIVAFCLRKKSLVIVMSWPIFSVSQCHGVLDPESRSRSFLVLESRYCVLFGLGISMLWYMHLHSLLFVFIVKIDYFNYSVEEYFNYPNLCNSYLHNVFISELKKKKKISTIFCR